MRAGNSNALWRHRSAGARSARRIREIMPSIEPDLRQSESLEVVLLRAGHAPADLAAATFRKVAHGWLTGRAR